MRILLGLVTLLAVVGLAVGGTFAVFTDTETATGNTFEAGTVDISVDTNNPWTTAQQVTADGGGTLLKPSQIGYTEHTINNVGNNPIHVWKKVGTVVDSGGTQTFVCGPPINGNVSSEPECAAEIASSGRVDSISTVIDYDLTVDLIELIAVSAGKTLFSRDGVWIYLGQLDALGGPNDSMLVKQSYHLKTSADNKFQGDKSTFNIEFWAGQVEGACQEPDGNACRVALAPGNEIP